MPQHIVVSEYNPAWPQMFEAEAEQIKQILGENCVSVYHIGSTSVTGLTAKPIIDIMPVVKDLKAVDVKSAELEKIGYEYMGEFGIAGRRYLRKGGHERTHHMHIFAQADNGNIDRHLAFRDYLRTFKDVRKAYGKLKIELAEKYPYDIDGYCDGKEEFIKKFETAALHNRNSYVIVKMTDIPELIEQAADWFHQKWGIPLEAYLESMNEAISNESAVPQWYIAKRGDCIIGGLGVIENDFHDRKDLTPNICAVYVEEAHRCQGISGNLLQFVCDDMAAQGIDTLYLITEHTSFYERYDWEFLCMVQGDGELEMSRMYIHKTGECKIECVS